jgi:hypothetical protein
MIRERQGSLEDRTCIYLHSRSDTSQNSFPRHFSLVCGTTRQSHNVHTFSFNRWTVLPSFSIVSTGLCLSFSGFFSLQVKHSLFPSFVWLNKSGHTTKPVDVCESVTLVENYSEVSSPVVRSELFTGLHVSLPPYPPSRCNVLYLRDSFVICILEGLMLTFFFLKVAENHGVCGQIMLASGRIDIHWKEFWFVCCRVLPSTTKQYGDTLCFREPCYSRYTIFFDIERGLLAFVRKRKVLIGSFSSWGTCKWHNIFVSTLTLCFSFDCWQAPWMHAALCIISMRPLVDNYSMYK